MVIIRIRDKSKKTFWRWIKRDFRENTLYNPLPVITMNNTDIVYHNKAQKIVKKGDTLKVKYVESRLIIHQRSKFNRKRSKKNTTNLAKINSNALEKGSFLLKQGYYRNIHKGRGLSAYFCKY